MTAGIGRGGEPMPPEIDRIEQLGQARNQALAALADIDRELKHLTVAAVRFGAAQVLVAHMAGLPRNLLDRWVEESRREVDDQAPAS